MRDVNSPIAPSSSRVVPIRVRVEMQRWMGKCRMQMATEPRTQKDEVGLRL